jgi:A/G-specific adenine glycosylase
MLQQTQAPRVAQKLPEFLEQFPTVHHLANASTGTIVRAWQGMGYNSRALRLRDAARMIVERFDGVVPSRPEDLRTLPGIGPYASASIACFAYDQRTVVLDVNIRRVYSRWMQQQTTTVDVATDARLQDFAMAIIPPRHPARWHNAVMELGAVLCTARTPQCEICPMRSLCPSAVRMTEGVRVKKAEPMFRGEPQRLWRGRAVEVLRTRPHGTSITLRALFKATTRTVASEQEMEWFRDLMQKIARDGLIVIDGDLVRLHE